MSTTVSTAPGQLDTANSSGLHSPEAKQQAILRAQQRARAFVSQTAPQSPVSSLPHSPLDSPLNSPSKDVTDVMWRTPLAPNKSQDTVKSSMKARPRLARANSEPPQKSVHFSTTNLVDVRQFKRSQKPCAVSKGRRQLFFLDSGEAVSRSSESAVTDTDEDDEDDDDDDDYDDDDYDGDEEAAADTEDAFHRSRLERRMKLLRRDDEVQKGWTLLTPGFVPYAHGHLPGSERPMCYLETLQLSPSQGNLRASIYVRNISYDKYVVLRYTVNNWASYGETQGVWTSDIRKFDRDAGYDRFDVSIPLDQFPSHQLNQSSMEICVRYVAGSQGEFWDNNGGKNYEIFLRNSNLGSRNTVRKSPTDSVPARQRHGSVPIAFGQDDDMDPTFSSEDFLKWAGLPMKNKEEVKNRDPFIDRYSFESSYNAAPKTSPAAHHYIGAPVFSIKDGQIVTSSTGPQGSDLRPVELKAARETSPTLTGKPTRVFNAAANSTSSLASGWDSESYNEFVSKYCFYTPARNTSSKQQTPTEPEAEINPSKA